MYKRRQFLQTSVAALTAAALPHVASATQLHHVDDHTPQPKPKLHKPVSLNIKDYGATGDGTTKDTTAIQLTIDRVAVFGGGEAVIPAGTFLTGGIELRSHVTLRFEPGAIFKGSPDFADYKIGQVRWEGKWIQGYLGLISARGARDIAITGPGAIMAAHELGGRPTPAQPLRHPCVIEPIDCTGVRLSDFSTDYFRMWSCHPTNCEDVTITNLTIRSTGGNGDGIDIDSCRRVRIDRCDIATGDDCISLKSGRGMEGYTLLQTTEDVVITNCTFADSIFACIGIGSETSGGIRNVRIAHCKFTAAKTHAIYIKSRPGRGAFIEDITVEDIDVANTTLGFLRLNMASSGLQDEYPVAGPEGIPTARNWTFRNIRVTDVPVLVKATELSEAKPLEGLTLENITGTCKQGITLANANNVLIRNIKVTGYEGPLLSTSNVLGKGLEAAAELPPPDPIPPVEAKPYTLK